jgi:hypothetical protein
MSEFADQFECVIKEKRELESRLHEALDEKAALTHLYEHMRIQFDGERNRLTSEIASLRDELNRSAKPRGPAVVDRDSVQSLLIAKEKLIKEEIDRKVQELTIEIRRERKKYATQIETMKSRLSNCICQ